MPQKESVTIELIGRLGGCTKQAVSFSKLTPLQWLTYRTRLRLALSGSDELLKAAKICLENLPQSSVKSIKTGRPGRPKFIITPKALAHFLMVDSEPNNSLFDVFTTFVNSLSPLDPLPLLDYPARRILKDRP